MGKHSFVHVINGNINRGFNELAKTGQWKRRTRTKLCAYKKGQMLRKNRQ